MLQLKPLDEVVPIFQQLATEQSPVILVNVFNVAAEDIPALLEAWAADANWMKQQPGWLHLHPIASRHRRQHRLHELRNLGVSRTLSRGVLAPRFQECPGALPVFGRCLAAPLRAAHRIQSLCGSVSEQTNCSNKCSSAGPPVRRLAHKFDQHPHSWPHLPR